MLTMRLNSLQIKTHWPIMQKVRCYSYYNVELQQIVCIKF